MPTRESWHLLESPLVQVWDAVCRAPRSGYGPLEVVTTAQIVLARRGVFVVKRRGEQVVVDTNAVLVFGLDDEYHVSHPTSGGDECTVFVLPPHLLEDGLGGVHGRLGILRPRDHLAACLVTRALRNGVVDQLEAEEATFLLLASVARVFTRPPGHAGCRLGRAQHLRVERARALLATSPETRWDLRALGQALSCSPFHLARQFRAATGETISRYLLRLRLGLAVDQLAEGERDLAMLAIGIGFAHHSHFSARFRSVLGMTPTEAREMLTKRKLDGLRRIVADASPAKP
jgi:AraC family transcriptional regulator